MSDINRIGELLGNEADALLNYKATAIPKESLHLPGSDIVERVYYHTDRSPRVLASLQRLLSHGRLSDTGYISILPVDQGIEHSAGASFAPNPAFFDPENIVKLAIEGGCSAVASTFGVLGAMSRKYAHKIPFVVKINHNEFLSYPSDYRQIMFGSVDQAFDLGATAVGATIYFGSEDSNRQIVEVADAFSRAHELGMATILWCYTRNAAFKTGGKDYHTAADLSGQANHLGVTLGADIIKQKMPTLNGGYNAVKNADGSPFGKTHPKVYSELTTDNEIDLTRYQLANCYMGRFGLISSGGASGENDLQASVRTAVINKRAGGMGLILGRKAFQKPLKEGIEILNAVQDVYLCKDVRVA